MDWLGGIFIAKWSSIKCMHKYNIYRFKPNFGGEFVIGARSNNGENMANFNRVHLWFKGSIFANFLKLS